MRLFGVPGRTAFSVEIHAPENPKKQLQKNGATQIDILCFITYQSHKTRYRFSKKELRLNNRNVRNFQFRLEIF